MYEDGFESSVPIYQEIKNPANINSQLTRIPFDKGAAILNMLENTVGKKNFRQHLKVCKY
jgi:aminopeptidase N